MKKIILGLVVALGMGLTSSFAQFDKGDKQVNIGIGLGSGGLAYGGFGYGLNISGEYGIMDNIGVGLHAAYVRSTYGYLVGYSSAVNHIIIGPRGSYHFNDLLKMSSDKFDIYASAGLLFDISNYSNTYLTTSTVSSTTVNPLFRVGGKYIMSESMALFADLGVGGNNLQAGISFILKSK